MKTFAPSGSPTVLLAASTTTSSASLDPNSSTVRVVNVGASMAFIKFGTGALTATAADMPIASGATETFTKATADKVAAITSTGTATLYFTNGEGI